MHHTALLYEKILLEVTQEHLPLNKFGILRLLNVPTDMNACRLLEVSSKF